MTDELKPDQEVIDAVSTIILRARYNRVDPPMTLDDWQKKADFIAHLAEGIVEPWIKAKAEEIANLKGMLKHYERAVPSAYADMVRENEQLLQEINRLRQALELCVMSKK